MKSIINVCALILLFVSTSMFSQDVLEIDRMVKANTDSLIQATQQIVLNPGTTITAEPGTTIRLQIAPLVDAQSLTENVVAAKSTTSVVIYPNPVEHTLYVETQTDEVIKTVDIYNFSGNKQTTVTRPESYNVVDVTRLLPGVHVVRVETDRGLFTFRIIKK